MLDADTLESHSSLLLHASKSSKPAELDTLCDAFAIVLEHQHAVLREQYFIQRFGKATAAIIQSLFGFSSQVW
jgi:hypothetical protein